MYCSRVVYISLFSFRDNHVHAVEELIAILRKLGPVTARHLRMSPATHTQLQEQVVADVRLAFNTFNTFNNDRDRYGGLWLCCWESCNIR